MPPKAITSSPNKHLLHFPAPNIQNTATSQTPVTPVAPVSKIGHVFDSTADEAHKTQETVPTPDASSSESHFLAPSQELETPFLSDSQIAPVSDYAVSTAAEAKEVAKQAAKQDRDHAFHQKCVMAFFLVALLTAASRR